MSDKPDAKREGRVPPRQPVHSPSGDRLEKGRRPPSKPVPPPKPSKKNG